MLLIDHETIGNQTQETNRTDNCKGEDTMDKEKIQALFDEVELYRQAIQDAQDALDSAEQELDETLAAAYEEE